MKLLKWIGVGLGALALLVAITAGAIFLRAKNKLDETFKVAAPAVAAATGPEAVAWGEHVMTIHGCQNCHGMNLAGQLFLDIPPGPIIAPNLTAGQGGVGASYDDSDWDYATRYGVAPDGSWLLPFMPFRLYHHIGDEDMSALTAYLKSLPPVDNELPPTKLRFAGYMMIGLGDFEKDVLIEAKRAPMPERGPTAEYGAYLAASSCVECHGKGLRGGRHPVPDAPPGPDLAGAGLWPFETFARAMREGVGPDGQPLSKAMPWPFFAAMTDEELRALQAHLKEILEEQVVK
ncbi:hypothetical protein BH24PSE2_BH24PSE2_01760 [soil metagenome]